ncbi:hypothetical protein BLNAU_13705 [Blattamonas nauphoetae]|uniref:Uncharacterized protein n=1 Tax=Blattamonas nauphoetae TaxID=2049346 RepID=A0ABQ9XM38_9EUKA|nr:hypothetical protein BLNAU_13705 [Blattamonas nauphoetae]
MELYFGTHSKTIELSYSEATSSFETLVSLSPGRFVYRFRTGEGHLFFDTTLLPMKSCDGHLGNSFVIEDSDDDDNWRNWNWNVSDSFWESSPTNAIRTAAMFGSDEGRDSCSAISFECLDESTPPSGTPPQPSWGFISARRNPHQTPPFQSFSTAIRTISSVRSHHFDPSVCPHFCNLQKETKTPHQLRNSPSPYHSPTPLPSVSPIPPVSPVWGSFHSHVTQTPINLPSLLQNTFTSPLSSDQLDLVNSEDESDFSLSSSSSESQHSSCASSSTLCSPSCHSIPISFSLPSSLLQPCSLYDPFNLASEFSNPARDLPQTVVHTSSALASLSSTFSSVPTPLHRQTISTQIVPHPTPPHRINISAFSSPPSLPVPSSLPPPLIAPCITHPSDDDSVTPSLASYARLNQNHQHLSSLLSTPVLPSSLSVDSSPHSPLDGWEGSREWNDLREMRWRQKQKPCSMERKTLAKGRESKRGRTNKQKSEGSDHSILRPTTPKFRPLAKPNSTNHLSLNLRTTGRTSSPSSLPPSCQRFPLSVTVHRRSHTSHETDRAEELLYHSLKLHFLVIRTPDEHPPRRVLSRASSGRAKQGDTAQAKPKPSSKQKGRSTSPKSLIPRLIPPRPARAEPAKEQKPTCKSCSRPLCCSDAAFCCRCGAHV